jgi:hypothetical protein
MDNFAKLLNENAVLPLEQAGKILGLKRGATYAGARSGDIKTIRIGRLMKVPTAWLRQKLGLDGPAAPWRAKNAVRATIAVQRKASCTFLAATWNGAPFAVVN